MGDLAARFQVPQAVARLAISRGVAEKCAELAERDPEPPRGFVAAVNVFARPRRRRQLAAFPPLVVFLARIRNPSIP